MSLAADSIAARLWMASEPRRRDTNLGAEFESFVFALRGKGTCPPGSPANREGSPHMYIGGGLIVLILIIIVIVLLLR